MNRPFAIPTSFRSPWERAYAEAAKFTSVAPGDRGAPAHGGYGWEFRGVNAGAVVRMTGDMSDAEAWGRVVQAASPEDFTALPEVDLVDTLAARGSLRGKGVPFYVIVRDALVSLSDEDAAFFDAYQHLILARTGGHRGMPVIKQFPPDDAGRILEEVRPAGITPYDIEGLVATLKSLQTLGVYVFNVSSSNVMRHPGTGRPMLSDLGAVTLDDECPPALDLPEIIAAADTQMKFRRAHLFGRRR
jgi:hypothetical protein